MATASDSSALTAEGTAAYKRQVDEAASALRDAQPAPPTVGILRDVELDGLLDEESITATVPQADLPHFPEMGGAVTLGTVNGTHVAELDQHLHLYAGHTPREVTFPVRMLAAAGVETLLLTAAAGSVNPQFGRGDLMLLTDHINFQGQNPLVGPNVEDWGPRFPDMTDPYDASLQQGAGDVARDEGISLQKGVYLALLGPNRETRAEHRMARRLGADAMGTSVVPEVIAARHMGVRVLTVALLSEHHLTDGPSPATAEDGGEAVRGARSRLHRLLTGVVARLDADGPPT